MGKLLQEEFFHLGTDKIFIEQWLNIQMDQIYKNCIKPYGGLWTSHQNPFSLCDWLEHKQQIEPFNRFDYYFISSCLIKFKENAKLLQINNENDYKNLKESGYIITLKDPIILDKGYYKKVLNELLDYEKISDFYDLLYVNNQVDVSLQNYSVKTMLALNPNSIEYYKPLVVDYENNRIIETKKKEYIKKPDDSFYKFIDYVRSLFYDIDESTYDEYIKKLYSLTKNIIKKINSEINNMNLNLPNYIDINQLIDSAVKNMYREKYRDTQKRLIKK